MKSYELKPTHENLLNTFLRDTIDRDVDIYRFVTILNNLEDSSSIALDGNWGSGKTFFVKQVKMVMDTFNDVVITDFPNEKEDIKQKWNDIQKSRKEVEIEPQVSVYYDAWLNDNDNDPILSLVYDILRNVNTNYSFKEDVKFLKIAGSIAGLITGRDVNRLIESFKRGDQLSEIRVEKDLNSLIDEFLDSLLVERGNRLVIFIDELDRCKPNYAVQLLERIKHYFSNDKITFVFSTNTKELQHTIKGHYGNDFDSYKYLDRFFDLRVPLPPANLAQYYKSINFDSSYVYDRIARIVIESYHFELREIAKYVRLLKIAAYKPTHGNNYDFHFPDEQGILFCLTYLVPIMVGLKFNDLTRYNNFINGQDSTPFLEIVGREDIGASMCQSLLSTNETYVNVQDQNIKFVLLNDKLNEVYRALFREKYKGNLEVTIGELKFSKYTVELLTRTVGLLSKYTDFNM